MSYELILLRHGQSVWNLDNIFTGWTDVELSERGVAEARAAGVTMLETGVAIDVVHTSVLRRAIDTGALALGEMGLGWVPVHKHWRLNERHYGALQGQNKKEVGAEVGLEQLHLWRRSYDTPPPPLEPGDPRSATNDPRYASLAPDAIPASESLADVLDRVMPYWHDRIVPDLRAEKLVLIAAHGNSLRALVKHLDHIPDEDIAELNIPTGVPLRYLLDNDLQPLESAYLGDPEAAAKAAAAVAAEAG